MKRVDARGVAPREARPASQVLHDEPNLRVVGFHLLPGQSVPPHHSASTVLCQVVAGSARFRAGKDKATLHAGESVVYAPGEEHAIEAGGEACIFIALIAPRPD